MFPEMRRFRQQLPVSECEEILSAGRRGVLSVNGPDGYPYGMPVNFLYEDGKIYFHGASFGSRVECLKKDQRACFTVYEAGKPSRNKRGFDVRSVIVFGKISRVEDAEKKTGILRNLGLKYFPDDPEYVEHEIEKSGNAALVTVLSVEHMTGKLVNES
ncbi:MAG: pyridoxamine 5'-phosphate oxidase family protein [Oscillospiraceae bacterium]|jgi:nitroimidazol reductase NimA-like FMN-containing flavoprotein (pyridoxamine 5'-phosphate oxidase superfamily)